MNQDVKPRLQDEEDVHKYIDKLYFTLQMAVEDDECLKNRPRTAEEVEEVLGYNPNII